MTQRLAAHDIPRLNGNGMSEAGQVERAVRGALRDVLGISQARVDAFDADTKLFGSLPELDSMAVAGLLTEMEDRLGIVIDDDDIDGDMLATFGALCAFAARKVRA
jgi:acyl carrier protein